MASAYYLHPLLRVFGSVVALILLLLCLIAGSAREVLVDAEIFRIELSNLPSEDVPNFINIYLMSYCVGHERHYIEADTNTTTTVTDLSECSDRSVLFHFKPFQAMKDSIGTALRPQGGDFPTTLSNEFDALAPASRAMTVFFIIGTAFVIFSTFIRVAAHHFRRRFARYRIPDYKARPLPGHPDYSIRGNLETPPSYLELVTLMLSTMTLLIASIITSVVATKFITLIRASGDPNVSARHNHNFLGMAWSATIIQALLTIHKVASLVRYEDRHSPWDTEEYSLTRDTGNKAMFTRLE